MVFHFHGLQNDESVAFGNFVTGLNVDCNYHAMHWRQGLVSGSGSAVGRCRAVQDAAPASDLKFDGVTSVERPPGLTVDRTAEEAFVIVHCDLPILRTALHD